MSGTAGKYIIKILVTGIAVFVGAMCLAGCTKRSPAETSKDTPVDAFLPSLSQEAGVYGGYFFIPINDKVYRYSIDEHLDNEGDAGNVIFYCTEDGCGYSANYVFYESHSYPQHEKIIACCDGSWFTVKYAPALKSSKGVIEDAIAANFVVVNNGEFLNGEKLWDDFTTKAKKGQKSSVMVGEIYEQEGNLGNDLRRATKEDYPMVFFTKIVFDGERYTVSPIHYVGDVFVEYCEPGYDMPENSYRFLKCDEETPRSDKVTDRFVSWYFVDDESVSYRQIMNAYLSSVHLPGGQGGLGNHRLLFTIKNIK